MSVMFSSMTGSAIVVSPARASRRTRNGATRPSAVPILRRDMDEPFASCSRHRREARRSRSRRRSGVSETRGARWTEDAGQESRRRSRRVPAIAVDDEQHRRCRDVDAPRRVRHLRVGARVAGRAPGRALVVAVVPRPLVFAIGRGARDAVERVRRDVGQAGDLDAHDDAERLHRGENRRGEPPEARAQPRPSRARGGGRTRTHGERLADAQPASSTSWRGRSKSYAARPASLQSKRQGWAGCQLSLDRSAPRAAPIFRGGAAGASSSAIPPRLRPWTYPMGVSYRPPAQVDLSPCTPPETARSSSLAYAGSRPSVRARPTNWSTSCART